MPFSYLLINCKGTIANDHNRTNKEFYMKKSLFLVFCLIYISSFVQAQTVSHVPSCTANTIPSMEYEFLKLPPSKIGYMPMAVIDTSFSPVGLRPDSGVHPWFQLVDGGVQVLTSEQLSGKLYIKLDSIKYKLYFQDTACLE